MSNKQTKKEELMKILMSEEACDMDGEHLLIIDLVKEQLENDEVPEVFDIIDTLHSKYTIQENLYSTEKCLQESDGDRCSDMWSDETNGAVYYNIRNAVQYFTDLGIKDLGDLEKVYSNISRNVLDDYDLELIKECIKEYDEK